MFQVVVNNSKHAVAQSNVYDYQKTYTALYNRSVIVFGERKYNKK